MNSRCRNLALLSLVLGLSFAFSAERSGEWVQQRVKQIKNSDRMAWRKIPWTASLLEARKVSQREAQPLFLFTLEGNIDTGRC